LAATIAGHRENNVVRQALGATVKFPSAGMAEMLKPFVKRLLGFFKQRPAVLAYIHAASPFSSPAMFGARRVLCPAVLPDHPYSARALSGKMLNSLLSPRLASNDRYMRLIYHLFLRLSMRLVIILPTFSTHIAIICFLCLNRADVMLFWIDWPSLSTNDDMDFWQHGGAIGDSRGVLPQEGLCFASD
jgi:hypothetical protein